MPNSDHLWALLVHHRDSKRGTPSLSCGLSFKVSNNSDEKLIKYGNRKITPNYVVTIMAILQTIPQVVEAAFGLMPDFAPGVNWMYDLRDSVK